MQLGRRSVAIRAPRATLPAGGSSGGRLQTTPPGGRLGRISRAGRDDRPRGRGRNRGADRLAADARGPRARRDARSPDRLPTPLSGSVRAQPAGTCLRILPRQAGPLHGARSSDPGRRAPRRLSLLPTGQLRRGRHQARPDVLGATDHRVRLHAGPAPPRWTGADHVLALPARPPLAADRAHRRVRRARRRIRPPAPSRGRPGPRATRDLAGPRPLHLLAARTATVAVVAAFAARGLVQWPRPVGGGYSRSPAAPSASSQVLYSRTVTTTPSRNS